MYIIACAAENTHKEKTHRGAECKVSHSSCFPFHSSHCSLNPLNICLGMLCPARLPWRRRDVDDGCRIMWPWWGQGDALRQTEVSQAADAEVYNKGERLELPPPPPPPPPPHLRTRTQTSWGKSLHQVKDEPAESAHTWQLRAGDKK